MTPIQPREPKLPKQQIEAFDEVAYIYDGSPEGLLCAIFEAYARRESPTDVWACDLAEPKLLQRTSIIETNPSVADRVKRGLIRKCGYPSYRAVLKAALAYTPDAATAAYRFIRYAMDQHTGSLSPLSNISHPAVEPIRKICKSVDNECERMLQFARFEHLKSIPSSKDITKAGSQGKPSETRSIATEEDSASSNGADFWLARINPKHSVVPLIMNYFVERFSIQAFVIYDEAHGICGVFNGNRWNLVKIDDPLLFESLLPGKADEEQRMQNAWRLFYQTISILERYNPELRLQFMPKRLWRNITEMQEGQGDVRLGLTSKMEPVTGIEPATH